MDLSTMRTIVRRELKDEDAGNYRWSDDELDRHIAHALKEFSEAVPLPTKATLPTTADSRVIDISPLADDASDYAYGSDHPVFEGRYRAEAGELNRLQVEGYDPAEDEPIVVDAFAWEEIERLYDRLGRFEDRNIDSVTGAEGRGEAYFRGVEMASVNGAILVPVNCGQQLYDVIDITDSRAGLSAAKRRVNGLALVYSPQRGEYRQRLLLGGV